jgi:hypothetical protein
MPIIAPMEGLCVSPVDWARQVGFGWTNGVVLHLLKIYGPLLERSVEEVVPAREEKKDGAATAGTGAGAAMAGTGKHS